MKKSALILISVATFGQQDGAQTHGQYTVAFVSAELYKEMPLEWRTAYLSGWADTHLNSFQLLLQLQIHGIPRVYGHRPY